MVKSGIYLIFHIWTRIWGGKLGELWFLTPDNGPYSAMNDPQVYKYYTDLSEYEFIRGYDIELNFSVSAYGDKCSYAFLLLSSSVSLNSSDFYEIFLGNATTIVRKRSYMDVFVQSYIPMPYTCNDFREFYLKITAGGLITLHTSYGHEAVKWNDPDPINIKGLGIKTGYGDSGTWIIKHTGQYDGFFCSKRNTYGNMIRLHGDLTENRVGCAAMCGRNSDCLGFNINRYSNQCQLLSTGQPVTSINSTGWRFFTKRLNNNKICLAAITGS